MAGGGSAIGLTIIGAVVGAGFASGQETATFFAGFGTRGFWAVVLAGALFYLGIWSLLAYLRDSGAASYYDALRELVGPRLAAAVDWMVAIFLEVGAGVMYAGGGEIGWQYVRIAPWAGVAIMAAMATSIVYKGVDGLIGANKVLVPIILLGLALLFATGAPGETRHDTPASPFSPSPLLRTWWSSAVLYVSYNMILVTSVMSAITRRLGETRDIHLAALTASVVLVLVQGLASIRLASDFGLMQAPLPFAKMAGRAGKAASYVYAAAMWSAMLTTATANLQAVASRASQWSRRGIRLVLLPISAGAVLTAGWSFLPLIRWAYPLFGYLGLWLLGALLWRQLLRGGVGSII